MCVFIVVCKNAVSSLVPAAFSLPIILSMTNAVHSNHIGLIYKIDKLDGMNPYAKHLPETVNLTHLLLGFVDSYIILECFYKMHYFFIVFFT